MNFLLGFRFHLSLKPIHWIPEMAGQVIEDPRDGFSKPWDTATIIVLIICVSLYYIYINLHNYIYLYIYIQLDPYRFGLVFRGVYHIYTSALLDPSDLFRQKKTPSWACWNFNHFSSSACACPGRGLQHDLLIYLFYSKWIGFCLEKPSGNLT